MKLTALLVASAGVLFACASASQTDHEEKTVLTNETQRILSPLVVGGQEVPVGTKLYMTGLRTTSYSDSFCGGVLITPTHILSAAHCKGVGYAAVGTHYIGGLRDGQQIPLVKVTRHPKYAMLDDNAATYDFAVFTLESPVVNIPPVALLRADPSTLVGQTATTLGWGKTGYPVGPSSQVLLRGDGPLVSLEACKAAGMAPLDDSMVCVGGAKNTGACYGDSGGPLILERPDGDVSIGIASWTFRESCGKEGKPVVFSRIAKVVDWIEANAPGVRFV